MSGITPSSPSWGANPQRRLAVGLGLAFCLTATPVVASTPNLSDTAIAPEVRSFLQQGQTFARDEQWQAAIALYKNALDINPELADAHFLIGIAHYQDDAPADAISALQRAGELNPRSARTFYNLGVAYAGTGEIAKEMAAYRKALKLDPGHISAHYNLGTAYWAQGKDDLACAKLYRAGRLYQEAGHSRQARQMLNLIQRIEPESTYRRQLAKVVED